MSFPFRTYVKTQPALIEARWTRIRTTEGAQPVGKDAAPEIVPASAANSAAEEPAIEATPANADDDFMAGIFGEAVSGEVLGKPPSAAIVLTAARENGDDDDRAAG